MTAFRVVLWSCYGCIALVAFAQFVNDPSLKGFLLAFSSALLCGGAYTLGRARGTLDGAEQREQLRAALAASTVMMTSAEIVMLKAAEAFRLERCPDCGQFHPPAPPATREPEH